MLGYAFVRRALLLALGSGLLSLVALAVPGLAQAANYGELTRFGGTGTGLGKFELNPTTHAFGVDPENNDVYVADEPVEGSTTAVFRIQQLSSTGVALASVEIEPNCGNECAIEGIAFGTEGGERRIYLLADYQRAQTSKIDRNDFAAGTLYAFSTTAKAGKLPPASGTTNGVLATPETLQANSEVQGAALIAPKGITVDPATGDVIVLGRKDVGKNSNNEDEERLSLERISSKGAPGARYVDPERYINEVFNSPVVTPAGQVLIEEGEAILQVPTNFEANEAPKLVFKLPPKENLILWGEGWGSGQPQGGDLTIGPEEAGGGGTIYANAMVKTTPESSKSPAILALHYEAHEGEVKLAELGWVGGKSEAEAGRGCLISALVEEVEEEEVAELIEPVVAAGKLGTVFVLDPDPLSKQEVIEFGENGKTEECPKASASEPEATVEGLKATKVHLGKEVTLTSTVKGANALSVQWNFGDGTPEQTVTSDEHQKTEVKHAFQTAGPVTVTEKIHVDNLASPTLEKTTKLEVIGATGEEAPKVTTQPKPQTVTEGETANFEAKASGAPTPEVKWEVKPTGGSWAAVPGGTQEKLPVPSTKPSESGSEYRATFTNKVGSAVTTEVLLIVNKKEAPKIKRSPLAKTVTEGESATFEAEAGGAPAPTAQWEVSTNKGASWGNVSGATSSRLTIANTTTSQSGFEYRATFSNGIEPKVVTGTARLTVNAKPPPPSGGGGDGGGGGSSNTATSTVTTTAGGGVLGATTKGPPPVPAANLASRSLVVARSGALTLKVSCPVGETSCKGTVTLRTVGAVSARVASAKKAILTLALGSFTVAGGQLKAIVVHLSAKARKLLAKVHVLRSRVAIVAHDLAGAAHTTVITVTLRLAKSSHH